MVATIERGTESAQRPSLLFVHGAMHGAWSWEEHFLPYFAEHGWHAVALDLRGHGDTPSDRSVTWVRMTDYVADLASVAQGFSRPPVIIAHSLGGFVTQRYMEDHRAAAAVLIGSLRPSGSLNLTLRAARHSPLKTARVFVTFKLLTLFGSPTSARYWFRSDETSEEEMATYVDKLCEESFRAVLDTMVRPVRTRRVIGTPILVVGGDQDRSSRPADQRVTSRKYGVEPVILPGLTHDLMIEPGWEHAADVIIEWLDTLA
ncbi:MAG: alpha/beta fold hydrolase [Nocardioides sp.]|uniref:alpha/beta hydrolase n=1 Tax=Nocardioides sp. TaxID=35761 RepID=UPI0039E49A7E